MLKAIHAQEGLEEAREKAAAFADKLDNMKLYKAAQKVRDSIDETLSYYHFPAEHKRHIWTNNPLERIMREIRRRTRVVGCFPDGNSAVMLAAARLRHIAGTTKNMPNSVTGPHRHAANNRNHGLPGSNLTAQPRIQVASISLHGSQTISE